MRGKTPIRFVAKAIIDDAEFHRYCPEPKPREKKDIRTGEVELQINDLNYIKQRRDWAEKKTHWMIWNSLLATPDLEWETVDPASPGTWKNYEKELREANFTQGEISMIVTLAVTANGVTSERLQEAREAFLSGSVQKESDPSEFQMDDQNST